VSAELAWLSEGDDNRREYVAAALEVVEATRKAAEDLRMQYSGMRVRNDLLAALAAFDEVQGQ
jgi:hypothetical protein